MDTWIDGLTNYFINRQTEGFIDKINVIKRRCCGILNVKHLFQHIHLNLEGYSLFAWFIKEICSTRITKEPVYIDGTQVDEPYIDEWTFDAGGCCLKKWSYQCDYQVPEFTTIAIPVAVILGLVFFFNRRKWRKGWTEKKVCGRSFFFFQLVSFYLPD